MILSVTLTIVLLFSISLIFSSFHRYFVNITLKQNNYHVYFESAEFKKPSFIKSLKYNDHIVYIKYKNVYDTIKNTKKICSKMKCKNIVYNKKVLLLYGAWNNSLMKSIKKILVTVLLILGFATFILIKNSFNLTLIQRRQHLGILKSVGMTKGQILVTLLQEGSIILLLSIIFGIVISLWFVSFLIFILNFLLKDIFEIKIILSFYMPFIVMSLVFIIILFYMSILIPSFKIGRLNIIALLRRNDTFKFRRFPRLLYNLNPIKRLSFCNYYRVKKKYRPIFLCVFITSILYISFSLYLNYGLSSINKYVKIPKYDFFLQTRGTLDNYDKLKKFSKKYKKAKIYSSCQLSGTLDESSYLNKKYKQNNVMIIKSDDSGVLNYINIYKKNGKIQNKNVKYLKDNVILNIGNSIEAKTINSIPFGLNEKINDNIIFFTDNFDMYCKDYDLSLYIKDKRNVSKDLNKLKIKDETMYTDVKKAFKITNNFVLALKISLYSILILVIVISISLIVSVFNVTIYQRQVELGVFKSIGMTGFQIKKMLMIETLIVIVKAFIFIVFLSYLISYILYFALNDVVATKAFNPLPELVICFVMSLIIIYCSLISSYNKINQKSLFMMVNNDNI